ncbi:serine/threonine-protein phosphatase 1 regulatory subunit 10 isoform X3 [Hydra vulgaris]|uniref:Serine/threonine-protein phosphatase 1 regulatory subunit 10 n=1 Tax=Hydra vulgaris TaxID=6087 RepID=A0ABM4BEB3_HYDVU
MGTSGGEPRVLLNALKPMLGVVGDIRTPQEVLRVVGMMKDAEKLMSRCVYLNVLKSTCRQALLNEEKKTTLDKFLATGGWGILNKWLHEFTKAENFPVLLELIDVLKVMPVTIDLLKQGNTGKIIKQMTKLENIDVKKNAGSLIKQWKEMIRGGPEKKTSIDNENNAEAQQKNKDSPEEDISESVQTKRIRELETKGPPEKRSKIKIIEALPKLADSSGFMNALNAAAPIGIKKKRKNSYTKTALPLDEILNNKNSDKKLKLEAENLVLAPENQDPVHSPVDDILSNYKSPAVEAANLAFAAATSEQPVPDENSIARKKNKKKRNITWAVDEDLVKICYFELQEGERKSRHVENFSEARHLELMLEKQAMRSARRGADDKMFEMLRWSRLIPVDNAGVPNFMPGEKSREKFIQAEREKSVLAFIFLTKESLPDTPGEPDFDAEDHSNRSQPRLIPHDEDGTIFPVTKSSNKTDSVNSLGSTPIERRSSDDFSNASTSPLSPKQQTISSTGVSTAVQNIMSQLMRVNNNQFPSTNGSVQSSMAPVDSNMSSSLQGKPGMVPNPVFRHPLAKNHYDIGNNGMENIRPPLMQPPEMRGGQMGGPRFRGPSSQMHRGGFNMRNGPPLMRPRWDGPPMEQDWDNFNHHPDQFHNNFQNGPFNEFNNQNNGGFENNHRGRGRGFRPTGGRGRGHNDRPNVERDWNQGPPRGRRPNENFVFDGPRDRRIDVQRNRRDENDNREDDRNFERNRQVKKAVCQHFQTPRGCRLGDRCSFMHLQR